MLVGCLNGRLAVLNQHMCRLFEKVRIAFFEWRWKCSISWFPFNFFLLYGTKLGRRPTLLRRPTKGPLLWGPSVLENPSDRDAIQIVSFAGAMAVSQRRHCEHFRRELLARILLLESAFLILSINLTLNFLWIFFLVFLFSLLASWGWRCDSVWPIVAQIIFRKLFFFYHVQLIKIVNWPSV